MPEIDWDDMIIPRNVPIVLRGHNGALAVIACGICDAEVAWTESSAEQRAMAFGDLAASFALHVDAEHGG